MSKKKQKSKKVPVPVDVAETIERVTGKAVGPYRQLLVADCMPNDWNPNRMSPANRDKLTRGIQRLLDVVGVIPPIIVRPHPTPLVAKWQIIDGFHRWDIYKGSGIEVIDGYVIDVDTATAMLLTETLNYLRGEPEPEAHAHFVHRLMNEGEYTPTELSEYITRTPDELQTMLDNYDLRIDRIEVPNDGEGTGEGTQDDPFVELKFTASRSQAEVIERELSRIGSLLTGKNVRGRALEFMAVNSSQTPIDNLMGENRAEEAPKKKRRGASA